MPAAIDPEQERIANLRRRAAMLERHARARNAEGKSALAVGAGRTGGLATVARHGTGSAWGLRMALKRWHGVELLTSTEGGASEGERERATWRPGDTGAA